MKCHGPLIQDCTQTLQQAFHSVDHLLLVALVLPVPAVMAAQVDEREQGWLYNSFCLGSVDHLLLVALVLPVSVVRAAQVDGEEARTDAQLLLGDGN